MFTNSSRGPWKLIVDNLGSGGFSRPAQKKPKADDPKGQLYNLDTDPVETQNLYAKHPDPPMRFLPSPRTTAFLACLILTSCSAPQGSGHAASKPAPIGIEDKPENTVKIRAALRRLLEEDSKASSKLLAFYLGGDSGCLGGPLGVMTRDYAEDLVFLELLSQKHTGEDLDRILERRTELNIRNFRMGTWQLTDEIKALHPDRLDQRCTLQRLDQRIHDLGSGKGDLLIPSVRELRVFDALHRIPDDREDKLRQRMVAAAETTTQTHDPELRLQLLRLMRVIYSTPSILNDFVWKAARDPSPEICAEALHVGLRFPQSKKDTPEQTRQYSAWIQHLISMLEDPRPHVAQEALIALEWDTFLDPNYKLTNKALDYLRQAESQSFPSRLLRACTEILSTLPYGNENPSPAQWWTLLAPLASSPDASLRHGLAALALHRFPASEEATRLVAALARDPEWPIRMEAQNSIQELDLDRADLPWLKKLFVEEDFLFRVILMSSVLTASGDTLDDECTATLLTWAEEERERAKTTEKNLVESYLYLLAYSQSLPERGANLLLAALESKNRIWIESACHSLAAHGLLPESEIARLTSALLEAKETDRFEILSPLYLQALRIGQHKKASNYLDELLSSEVYGTLRSGLSLPLVFALQSGRIKKQQKQAIVDHLAVILTEGLSELSRNTWRLLPTLGPAWAGDLEFLEMDLESLQEEVQAKKVDWFQSLKDFRGLTLLLEALGR